MPQFEYQAVDSNGRMHSGLLDALNANEAVQRLSSQGLIVQGLNIAGMATGRAPVQQINLGVPQVVAAPQSVQQVQNFQSAARSQSPTKGLPRKRYTGFFKDHDQWMLLAQMATILKAGINPHEMLVELSRRHSLKPKVRAALEEMAVWTGAGHSLADAMSVYPEIFPEGAVGATRAGETGGYLWQALENTSMQIQSSWKLRRIYVWVTVAFWTTVLSFPFVPAMKAASMTLAKSIDGGPSQNFVMIFFEGFKSQVFGLPGFTFLMMTLIWLFGPYITSRHAFMPIRHRLGATLPLIGRRSRSESGRELTYHLERLSSAGLSPMRSWQLAAAAIPNLKYRNEMIRAGANIREDTSYSQLLPATWLSPGFADLIRTGELTGTTPQAFEQVQRLSEGEQKTMEVILKVKAAVWVGIMTIGVGAIIVLLVYRDFNLSMMEGILGE